MDVPENWNTDAAIRSRYSSVKLDEFHRGLLNSTDEQHQMHGILSVVSWGFASGADGRIHKFRALSRSRVFVQGRKNAPAQTSDQIIAHLRRARELLYASRISDALQEAMKIKFLGMSFASKVLMFMNPSVTAVYDDIISSRLQAYHDPTLRSMYVSTNLATSRKEQSKKYELWCRWCLDMATKLNDGVILWTDWNGEVRDWRTVDVERAFFALGR